MKLKYPESILALNVACQPNNLINIFNSGKSASSVNGTVLRVTDSERKIECSDLIIANRTMLESNRNFRQIITYFQFRKPDGEDRQLTALYQRVKGSGEGRLLGNYSVGFGGHVESSDVMYYPNRIIDLQTTLYFATGREIMEEVKFIDSNCIDAKELETRVLKQLSLADADYKFNTYVWDSFNDVGSVHLGVLSTLNLAATTDLICNEESMIFLGFKTNEELLSQEIYDNLEHWSKLVVEHNHREDNKVETVSAEA